MFGAFSIRLQGSGLGLGYCRCLELRALRWSAPGVIGPIWPRGFGLSTERSEDFSVFLFGFCDCVKGAQAQTVLISILRRQPADPER